MESALSLGLVGLVAPAALSAALLLAGHRPWRRTGAADGSWVEPLALPLAFAVAYALTRGLPPWPPLEAVDWLLWLGLLAGGLGALDARLRAPAWLRRTLGALLLLAVPALVLLPIVEHEWGWPAALSWLVGLGAVVVALGLGLEELGHRAPGPGFTLGLLLTAAGGALALALSGTAAWALLAGALAAALGVLFLSRLLRRGPGTGRGIGTPFAVILGGLWIAGAFYADLPPLSLGLLVLGALSVWLTPRVTGAGPQVRGLGWTLARLAPAFVLAAASVAWAWLSSPPLG